MVFYIKPKIASTNASSPLSPPPLALLFLSMLGQVPLRDPTLAWKGQAGTCERERQEWKSGLMGTEEGNEGNGKEVSVS